MTNTYDKGFGFMVDMEYILRPNLSLVLYIGHNNFKSKIGGTDDLGITNISLNAKYYRQLPNNLKLCYYVNAGSGYYITSDSHKNIGTNLGTGLSYTIVRKLSLEFGPDWHTILNQNRTFIQIHLGFSYRF
jgi:opacity protein-like surface antigen